VVLPMRADLADMRRVAGWILAYLAIVAPANAFQLVTAQEAAYPPDESAQLSFRNPTRRPTALIIAPAPNAGVVKSPFYLKIRFQAFGGAKINTDSIVVTYLKKPAINLTQRLTPFISARGIDLPDAEVPAGTHQFWIELTLML